MNFAGKSYLISITENSKIKCLKLFYGFLLIFQAPISLLFEVIWDYPKKNLQQYWD